MTWRSLRVKHLASIRVSNIDKLSKPNELPVRLVNYTDVYHGDKIVPELELMPATATASQVQTFKVQPGDVLITKDSETADDIGVPAYVERSSPDMVCGYHLALLRPIPQQTFGRFLYWAMNSKYVNDQLSVGSTGITRYGLKTDVIAQTRINLPALSRQLNIANYLDTQTGRIDALISKINRLVELLKEYADSVVFDGITGRLTSSHLSFKFSGVDWLGDIPKHFGTPWLGAFHTTQLGKMLNVEAASGPDQYPYIKNTNVRWDHFDLDDLPTMSFDASDRQRCELRIGDVLVCEGGEAGRSAVWNSDSEIFFQKALHRIRPLRGNVPRYLMYCLWAAAGLGVFQVEGNQATIVHLTGEKLREHRFPWPPLAEQKQIVELIDAKRQRIDQAVVDLQKQIELLTERRQALITNAVTGQKSVPAVII